MRSVETWTPRLCAFVSPPLSKSKGFAMKTIRIRETMAGKRMKKKYKIAVLTNGNASSQRRKLNTINIYDLLDYSLVSSEYGVRKPDKQIFEYTAKQLGLETEECAYVGDNYKIDILGSRNAGMLPVFISRNNEIHDDVLCIQTINELLHHF